MPRPHLEIRGLRVDRGGRTVLQIDRLELPRQQVTALIGPNGAGKSSLLAALQLVLRPSQGELLLDGEAMTDDPVRTRRRMAAAFQEPLLLSMSVRDNVELPLRLRGVGRQSRRDAADRWLERFGVAHLAKRHARQLSGGEAQRVSLARALAAQPEVLLLDEPFAGVDAPTRAALIDDFAAILSETRPTTVLVTHDRGEALRLADHAALIVGGHLLQSGPPQDVFARPASLDAARFLGVDNLWPGRLIQRDGTTACYQVGGLQIQVNGVPSPPPQTATLCLRPELVEAAPPGAMAERPNQFPAVIRSIIPAAALTRARLESDSTRLHITADIPTQQWPAQTLSVGAKAVAHLPPQSIHLIPDPDAD